MQTKPQREGLQRLETALRREQAGAFLVQLTEQGHLATATAYGRAIALATSGSDRLLLAACR